MYKKYHVSATLSFQTYSCTRCSSTFDEKEQLRLHMAFHTGDMPYKVTLIHPCSKYQRWDSIDFQHCAFSFQQCSLCPEQFLYKKNLSFHMMKIHGFPKPHAVSFWWHADVVMVSIMFLLLLYVKLFFFQSLVSPVPKNILNQNRTVRARSSQTSRWKAVCVRGVWTPGVQPKWPADTH